MSNSQPPNASTPPSDNSMHQSFKRQLPFSTMMPPFVTPGDYHRFAADPHRRVDQETEAIVVKSPQLKRKSDAADHEAESSERTTGPGYTEIVSSPLQTPVSGKGGKVQKTSRLAKNSKSGPQTSASNLGSPGNNLTPTGPCRYDSSLGLLTKKFINLIKHAEDGILDLNENASSLQEAVECLAIEERRLDEQIRDMQERLRDLSEDENNQKWLFVTEDDIKSLPCFQNETLIAIKAPHGTTLEVPDPDEAVDYPQRRYRIFLRSTMGPIDVYLVSQFEEKFEDIHVTEATPNLPSSSGFIENPATNMIAQESRGKEIEMQGQDAHSECADLNASQDFVSGIMKIVPSEVDSDADYWLLSDAGVSITDIWRTEPGVEWSELGTLHEDYAMAAVSTPQAQTPPSNPTEVASSTTTGR